VCGLLSGCSTTGPAPVDDLTGRDYSSSSRGEYRGSYYTVNKGDTLYFIAYISDKDVDEIVQLNKLSPPYTIFPGQRLNLWQPVYEKPAYGKRSSVNSGSSTKVVGAPVGDLTNNSIKNTDSTKRNITSKNNSDAVKKVAAKTVDPSPSNGYGKSTSKENVKTNLTNTKKSNTKISRWLWPTKGRVISKFSAGDQGNKGIDIAGQRGQPVVTAAAGTVVYSGNALRGYGNLVIIKHNDNYLSAYAHNDRLLVREGQSVEAGQKIASMGSSGTNRVKLHFEIRYQGKSVNPLRYLP
jgi:lipoprotein NlpD